MPDAIDDEISDVITDIASRDLPSPEKAALLEQAAGQEARGSRQHGAYLLAAGEFRQLAGDFAEARRCFDEAAADEADEGSASVPAHLIRWHLAQGQQAEADEIARTRMQESREIHLGWDYHFIGESYEEAGLLRPALRWFSLANRDVDPDDFDDLETLALEGRARVRRQLGLPFDRYDETEQYLRDGASEHHD